jgi:hypothetical protein
MSVLADQVNRTAVKILVGVAIGIGSALAGQYLKDRHDSRAEQKQYYAQIAGIRDAYTTAMLKEVETAPRKRGEVESTSHLEAARKAHDVEAQLVAIFEVAKLAFSKDDEVNDLMWEVRMKAMMIHRSALEEMNWTDPEEIVDHAVTRPFGDLLERMAGDITR